MDLETIISQIYNMQVDTLAMVSVIFDELAKDEEHKKAINEKFEAKKEKLATLLGLDAHQE